MTADALARQFHEAYERLAPQFGYATREASAVPWEQVPEPNRSLMLAVAAEVLRSVQTQDNLCPRCVPARLYEVELEDHTRARVCIECSYAEPVK